MNRAMPRPAWIALGAIVLLAGVLFVYQLDASGYANTYYSAAALAAAQSWSAFFFGSVDSANFITIDKPPLATMLMGLSVRLFGLSSWSILLPEAILGIASVVVLFDAVRRQFGYVAGLVAALVMTLTPVAVLMFRYNNPDALLTFLLVAAAWALVRALESGRLRWLLLSAAALGLGFNTKYLQADIVVPVFALVYLIAGRPGIKRRFVQLVATAATLAVTSGWWMVIVDAIPATMRPYIGGSTNNSVLDLVLGYDGLGRILGQAFGRAARGAASGIGGIFGDGEAGGLGFGGTPGLLRLFNSEFAGQVSWLIPLAVVALVAGLVLHARASRTDPARAGYILWGGWLVIHAAVFSFASGIIHPYYTVVLAPALGAIIGAGAVDAWRHRGAIAVRATFAAGIVATTLWARTLLAETPTFAPGLGNAALALAVLAALALVAAPVASKLRAVPAVALAAALLAALLGPSSYALASVGRAYAGGVPSAGPAVAAAFGPGGAGFASRDGGFAANGDGVFAPPSGGLSATGPGDGGAGGPVERVDQALIDFLLAHRGNATWIVAANGAQQAGAIELATHEPVLAIGGFSGSDPAPTLDQLKALVAAGKLRYVLVGGAMGEGFGRAADSLTQWITSNGTAVDYGGSGGTLYDLSAAKTS